MNIRSLLQIKRRLPFYLAALLLAGGALAAAWWKTQYAWRDGYGDEDMSYFTQADPRALSGGDMTVFHTGFQPFAQSPNNLPWQYEAIFEDGDGIFDKNFIPGDGTTASQVSNVGGTRRRGLGPLFNASGCAECHFRDGRVERPYASGDEMLGMFLRLSVPDGKGGWKPPEGYHHQLHDRAIAGVPPEGKGHIDWEEIPGQFPDGETYTLRQPNFRVTDLAHGPLPADTIIEARTSPPAHGGGLLEAIADSTLLGFAEEQRNDPDEVSGKPNYLTDPGSGKRVLGRFSLKANEPSLRAQAAGASFNDMGVTSPIYRHEGCLPHQKECAAAKHGGTPEEPELSAKQLEDLTIYLQLLAVPARRNLDDPMVLRGEELFQQSRCNVCHVDTVKTGDTHPIKRLRNQTIHPYTDLLLHDMGPGLSGRPDGEATAQEWRTPPLWGIGLTERSNHHTNFLHDQRARGFQEAILWHDGEAAAAKKRFMDLSREERAMLIRFLESL
ncbi:MAG: c-type cytochrome [Candidatus Accumulibacter sp.]|jgi:CxxC motif-containing protein (DUF1111 family)|nr:c-type cytochrome [Accumulibacter sp.]